VDDIAEMEKWRAKGLPVFSVKDGQDQRAELAKALTRHKLDVARGRVPADAFLSA
jgi:hypothetical protein